MESEKGNTSHKMRLVRVTVDGEDMQIGSIATLRLITNPKGRSITVYIDGACKVGTCPDFAYNSTSC